MTRYQIYLYGSKGELVSRKAATCRDDDEARAVASMFANPTQSAEVWSGTKRLDLSSTTSALPRY